MKKCRYKYCKHASHEVEETDAIKIGSSYYHKDCYAEKLAIDGIIDLWVDKVDSDPVFTRLRQVINRIVYDKGFPANKLLFYLHWAVKTGWPIKHPPGLFYLIKDEKAEAAWRAAQAKKAVIPDDFVVVEDHKTDNDFVYKPQKSGFGRILRG